MNAFKRKYRKYRKWRGNYSAFPNSWRVQTGDAYPAPQADKDWGDFYYCEAAIEKDQSSGLWVDVLPLHSTCIMAGSAEGGMIVLKGKALPALGDILRVVGEAMEMSDD